MTNPKSRSLESDLPVNRHRRLLLVRPRRPGPSTHPLAPLARKSQSSLDHRNPPDMVMQVRCSLPLVATLSIPTMGLLEARGPQQTMIGWHDLTPEHSKLLRNRRHSRHLRRSQAVALPHRAIPRARFPHMRLLLPRHPVPCTASLSHHPRPLRPLFLSDLPIPTSLPSQPRVRRRCHPAPATCPPNLLHTALAPLLHERAALPMDLDRNSHTNPPRHRLQFSVCLPGSQEHIPRQHHPLRRRPNRTAKATSSTSRPWSMVPISLIARRR